MAHQTTSPDPKHSAPTQSVVLHHIPWEQYLSLRDVTEGQGLRLTYLDGALEIMSPSEQHEESKTLIGRLLETWAVERDIDLRGFGSTTWRSEASAAGAEADEAYRVGKKPTGTMPDLAIEVVVSSPSRNKLEVYARLGVREIWTWWPVAQRLVVQTLVGDRYEELSTSGLFPELDIPTLLSFAVQSDSESHTALIRAYRATLIPAG